MTNRIIAAYLTVALLVAGIAGDALLSDNPLWTRIENILNFPVWIAQATLGSGHGFAQLVLPSLFALLFYYTAFWFLLVKVRGRGKEEKR